MSKKKDRKKNQKKTEKDIVKTMLRMFTEASASVITQKLHKFEIEDIFLDVYINLKNDHMKHLNKEYEKMLLLSIVNRDNFVNNLDSFYRKMASYVKEQKIFPEFYDLCYQVLLQMEKKEIHPDINDAYQDLLMQQIPYFTGTPAKCIYGLHSKGYPLIMDEPGENLSTINFQIYNHQLNNTIRGPLDYERSVVEIFRKNGYPLMKTFEESQKIITNDQMITNMSYFMTPFIDESVEDIIKKPFHNPNLLFEYSQSFRRKVVAVRDLHERLVNRETLLPPDGVYVQFFNTSQWKELYLKEIIKDDTVILLYRIQTKDNTYLWGYYDTQNQFFMSLWRESNARLEGHYILESIVLQQYLRLTTAMLKEQEQEFFQFTELKNAEEGPLYSTPAVYYSVQTEKRKGKRDYARRYFDRKKYIQDVINIHPFLRNLPAGRTASEEAINKAKKLGITLPPGKTFVSGFRRASWKKNEDS